MTKNNSPEALAKVKIRNREYYALHKGQINANKREALKLKNSTDPIYIQKRLDLQRKKFHKQNLKEDRGLVVGKVNNYHENDPTNNDKEQIYNSVEEFMSTVDRNKQVFSGQYLAWLDKEAWNIKMKAGDIINYIMSRRVIEANFFDLMSHDERINLVIRLEGIVIALPTDDKSLRYSTENFNVISDLEELFKTKYYTDASSIVSRQSITAYILEQRKIHKRKYNKRT